MRVLALDVGTKRTGVAISDTTGTLARPLSTISGRDPLGAIVSLVAGLTADEDGLERVVLGLPMSLAGEPTAHTAFVRRLGRALERRLPVPVSYWGERLTSVEAESRLAEREKDWRRRKARLDAAAAAVILQEFLDARRHGASSEASAAPSAERGEPAS